MFTADVTVRRLKILVQQYVETARNATMWFPRPSRGRNSGGDAKALGKAFDDLIAACAIEHGLGVLFDNPGTAGTEAYGCGSGL